MITRGEQMLALRRRRMASASPFFRGGFRPFFFGGAAWGLAALLLWTGSLSGFLALPTHFDPLAWHRHEMLFGFVGAIVGGFMLTAIPNWTGRLPIAGRPLAALFSLWAAGRVAVLCSEITGRWASAAIDVSFYLLLAFVAAREVMGSRNRNLPIVGLVLLFGLANALDHAGAARVIANADLGWMFALSLVLLMISLIGGRIVPSFTRNWMTKRGVKKGLPTQPGRFDLGVIGATAIAMLAWMTAPESTLSGGLLVVAAALQAVRMARWGGLRTISDPLVVILHIGYAWMPFGLLLLGLTVMGNAVPRSVGIHALTAGAMTTMILAVMTRASLGHTGRELRANAPTIAIYVLVTAGAALRVTAPLGWIDYMPAIRVSALTWGAALLLFLIAYGPVLFRPRLGETVA
jgi:uncharacterized protein involved in response to NO